MNTMTELKAADLTRAYEGSWYTISGAGGDLDEWVTGYGDLLVERGMSRPSEWFRTTGAEINDFARRKRGRLLAEGQPYPNDLVVLLFPIADIENGGRLPIFKVQMEDRWFDDVIDNMVRSS